jgi:hypothetical protein
VVTLHIAGVAFGETFVSRAGIVAKNAFEKIVSVHEHETNCVSG